MSLAHLFRAGFVALLLIVSARAATVLVDDTFADGNSRNQDLAVNSLNVFDGRTGPAGTSGGTSFTRTDAVGAMQLNLSTSTSSQGAWAFFTGAQASTTGTPPVSSGAWSNAAPVVLQVGDTLTFVEKFSVTGLKAGQDIRVGLFDSNGTRNLTNVTGGQNDASFSNDTGYGLDFFLSGNATAFAIGKRDLSLASSLGALNNLFLNFGAFPQLPAALGTTPPPAQALVNNTVYTLTFSVCRQDASTNVVTATVSGGTLPSNYTWQVTDTNAPLTTFDTFTAARFNGAAFADRITFTEFQVVFSPAKPAFTAQPTFASGATQQTIGIGGQVTISATATGSGLTYQWRHDGVGILSATTPTLVLTQLQLADSGSYDLVVSNESGSVTSDPVTLSVVDRPVSPPPTIDMQPISQAVDYGSTVSFSVGASGENLLFQWSKDGGLLSSANTATLTLSHVTPADAGNYQVTVSNEGGTLTSAVVKLTVLSPHLAIAALAPASSSSLAVNPDTPLRLTFLGPPSFGTSGTIKIYDAATDAVVDTIDASSPAQTGNLSFLPGTPYQVKSIGGAGNFTYYPVIVTGNTATLYPRNGTLTYGKIYYVKIDPGFFRDALGSFAGIADRTTWRFTTKAAAPAPGTTFLTIAADGSGDFNTVQGALDFIPTGNTTRTTLFIRKGVYNEIIYFQNRNALTFLGEDRQATILTYPNNNNFNPVGGIYHRGAFYGNNVSDTVVTNLTIKNATPQNGSQAEALILSGGANARNLVTRVDLLSFQDTLQLNGPAYVSDSRIEGDVDFIWGNGPAFFRNCDLKILRSGAFFTQIRNDATRHGFVFLDCRLSAAPGVTSTYLARIDPNVGQFPNSEVVWLNSTLVGDFLAPAGWLLNNATSAPTVHFWEYHSQTPSGALVDVSGRAAFSRQLTLPSDAQTVSDYSTPSFVLGGWSPQLSPIIVQSPVSQTVIPGQSAVFTVDAAAIPAATYQWFKDGAPIAGATSTSFTLASVSPSDAGSYSVVVTNPVGFATSQAATLTVQSPVTVFTTRFGLDPATTGAADADPDGDGVPNLIEFLLGGDPTVADNSLLPVAQSATTNQGLVLVYQYDVQIAASAAVSSWVEYSGDLATWIPAVDGQNGVTISITSLNAETERITVVIPVSHPPLFARLKASEL